MILQEENFFILLGEINESDDIQDLDYLWWISIKKLQKKWSFSIFNAVFLYTANFSESPTRHSDYVVN